MKETLVPIREKAIKIIGDMRTNTIGDFECGKYYAALFDDLGVAYSLNGSKGNFTLDNFASSEPFETKQDGKVDSFETINNLRKEFDGFTIQRTMRNIYVVGEKLLLDILLDPQIPQCPLTDMLVVMQEGDDKDEILKRINKCIVYKNTKNEKNSYLVAYRGNYSIETTLCKFKDWDTDIAKNYNDDIPYNEINDIIRADGSGLILLYGSPGTGKSSLIKSLINENPETSFIFVDSSICDSISDGMFLDFLQEHRNSVIVFEDCEKLLIDREEGNETIGTILNLTDGILAETMKIKFICTFNSKINKVDAAVLRKGRMSLKYEFKELSLEKVKQIYPEATKAMTLADAYHAKKKNDYSNSTPRKKIGFNT